MDRRHLIAWSLGAVLACSAAAAAGVVWYDASADDDTVVGVATRDPARTGSASAHPRTTPTAAATVTPSAVATTPAASASSSQPPSPAPAPAAGTPAPASMAVNPLAGAVIVLDPGHNGGNAAHPIETGRAVDAGGFEKPCNTAGAATVDGYPEAAFTWDVAVRTRELLEGAGAVVILTRTDNDGWGPCVDQRGRVAAQAGAALLLSIHGDGAAAGSGFHVIAPAARSGWTEETAAPSADLARSIRDAMVAGGFSPADYIGSDGLDVRGDLGTLNWAGRPAVIVECGNMRDADDAAVMSSEDGRQRIAKALVAGVAGYLG